MKRRKRNSSTSSDVPVWMITFSDLVTLLMTFFIVLVSMASLIDVYKRKAALGSVSGTFGTGAPSLDDLTTKDTRTSVEPGPINLFQDLAPLEAQLWEKPDEDLRFESNAFIQRVSISADALFGAGSSDLTDKGRAILDRLLPVMVDSSYPLSLSGHTADGLGEFGSDYRRKSGKGMDFSWELSLARVGTVYRYFMDAGLDPEKLRVEAFGRFRPADTNQTPEGRRFNRRVEITLDRRIGSWSAELESARVREKAEAAKDFRVWDFIFRFGAPGER